VANGHTTTKRKIDDLRPHDLLGRLLSHPPQEDLDDLARELEAGQPYLLNILPDNIVLSGLRLLIAAKQAGRKSVQVDVHPEWDGMDPAVIGLHVVAFHIDKPRDHLETARMFAEWRRWRITLPKPIGLRKRALELYRRDLDKQVKTILRKSPRTLERYQVILNLPHAIQQACRTDQLPLTLAVKIPRLPCEGRRQLFTAIEGGGNVFGEVKKALGTLAIRQRRISFRDALQKLEQARQGLELALPSLKSLPPDAVAILASTRTVIDRVVQLPREETTTDQPLPEAI
jgi:hypothetical protein